MPDGAAPTAGLGRRAARGALVTLTGQGVRIGVQLVSVVVLARLLGPEDYGILAMVTAVVGVGEIFRDFGLSSAAVQAKTLTRGQRDNLFWINCGIGVVLALTACAIAVPLSAVYDHPELVAVTRVLSITFVLNGMSTQLRADLVRRLRFTLLAAAESSAPALALVVAIVAAANGAGYWALVAQQISQALLLLVAYATAARWRPRLPQRGEEMRPLLRFGWNLVGTQLIGYASNNVDSVTIGIRFGASPLGLYNRAFSLLISTLSQLRAPTTTVALPVLSQLSDQQDRYDDFVRRGQLALGYSLVLGLGLVAGAAEPLGAVLLGPQWTAVTPLLQLLAVAGAFQTLAYVGYWVYLSRGLTGDLFRYSLVTAAIKVVCVLVGSTWGVVGVAAGYAIAPAIAWPLSLWWLSRCTTLPARDLAIGALRLIAVTAVQGAAAFAATTALAGLSPGPRLAGAIAAGLLADLVMLALPTVRRDVRDILEVVRLALKGRRR